MKLLHIDSSILGENSASRELTKKIVMRFRELHDDLHVTYRDLTLKPLSHLSGLHLAAAQGFAPEPGTMQEDLEEGQAVLEEFLATDTLVLGAPMYNFSLPTQLKAWIDRIVIAGKTFRYTEAGAEGLAGGKKVIIASARGGVYTSGAATAFLDHQEAYLRGVFNFVGITDISVVRAEGLNLGPDQRTKSIREARDLIVTTVD